MDFTLLSSLLLGLGLSSAAGFRLFVPAFALSAANYFGLVPLSTDMAWVGSLPALISLGVASVVELIAYFIPFVDNLLDTISAPAAAVCGTLLMGASISDIEPALKWIIAIIAGGGTAAAISGGTAVVRAKSSVLTAGVGNPVLATSEFGLASVLSVLSIFAPIIVGVLVISSLFFILKWRFSRINSKRQH